MRHSVDEMKEQRYQDQFAGQQKQIQDITNILKQTLDTIADLKKGSTGRSEMDIIHEIITGVKEEASGARKDIKEAFTSSSLPPGKTAQERESRKKRVKGALKTDQERISRKHSVHQDFLHQRVAKRGKPERNKRGRPSKPTRILRKSVSGSSFPRVEI
ncbi:hypothetical protein LCGC14_1613690 [marine sediment metagenome]|uniref:Uncharacterized protein n=1 Tax=marine sediment metagenome TaxID=412755 RepID=A0A0F9KN83_9ZZZZ